MMAASVAKASAAPDARRPALRTAPRVAIARVLLDFRGPGRLAGGVELELDARGVALVGVVRRAVQRHGELVAVLVARGVGAERVDLVAAAAHLGERALV